MQSTIQAAPGSAITHRPDPRSQYLTAVRAAEAAQAEAESLRSLVDGARRERRADRVARLGKADLLARGVEVLTDEEQRELQAADQDERLAKLLRAAGIPGHFENASFDDLNAIPMADREQYRCNAAAIRNLLTPANRPRIYLLCGPPGTGKTFLACAAVLEAVRRGQFAMYWDTRDFLDLTRATMYGESSTKWSGDRGLYERCVRAKLLVLDEIVGGLMSDFARERIEQVLDGRYRQDRDSVLISNALPDVFHRAIGDRLFDRAAEAGGIIEFSGESLRGRLIESEMRGG